MFKNKSWLLHPIALIFYCVTASASFFIPDGSITLAKFATGTIVAPTYSIALSSGVSNGGFGTTQQGWLVTSSTSVTAALGDTYTNNSHTYTFQAAVTAQTGQFLFLSGTGAFSGTTLTRATGSGSATITFLNTGTGATDPIATYLYTVPTSPRQPAFIRVKLLGPGGGGQAYNSTSGVAGKTSIFGTLYFASLAGQGGAAQLGGAGGLCLGSAAPWTGTSTATVYRSVQGGSGEGSIGVNNNTVGVNGGGGGNSTEGGAGGGGASTYPSSSSGTGYAAATNSGSGGGGGGGTFGAVESGSGGGAGCDQEFIIYKANLATTYLYAVGTGGTATANGGVGAAGKIVVEEAY